MNPRIHVPDPLRQGATLALPQGPSRHLQVLRLQPGAAVCLFDGQGGEWDATIVRMGRQVVEVELGAHHAVERELARHVTLAVGMPANDRMDDLVEKASELGVAAIQPLLCERSVLRLGGERAERKAAHWQAVAAAASEQCGRNRVARIEPVRTLADWLRSLPPADADGLARSEVDAGSGPRGASGGPAAGGGAVLRGVLSLRDAVPWARAIATTAPTADCCFLSGPEGGLAEAEEAAARGAGFRAVSLGPRVLRADTAPLAALAAIALAAGA